MASARWATAASPSWATRAARSWTRDLKCSDEATKSVSHLSSTMAPGGAVDEQADGALGVLAVVALGRGGQALLPQPLLGGLGVAVVGLEGALGVHHAGAGGLAQRLHVLGGERHGYDSWLSVAAADSSSSSASTASGGASAATGPRRRR